MSLIISKYLTFGFIVAGSEIDSRTSQPNPSASLDAECRTIQHEMGETCVPNEPQRMVVLNRGVLANALLGLMV